MTVELVGALASHEVPLSLAVITFTESSRGCFVSLEEFPTKEDITERAVAYVTKNIKVRCYVALFFLLS